MTELSNPFDLLNEDIAGSNDAEPKDLTSPESQKQLPQAWADMSEDSDDPLDEFGNDDSQHNTDTTSHPHLPTKKNEVSQSIREADLEWSKKIVIEVKHDVRSYDKETDKLTI